ncbi:MAG: transcriptional initiation protein Tat [Planctomycetes bacterium]|nr:transcriptional initiation protein Tat [Planctomycetota bacterium]
MSATNDKHAMRPSRRAFLGASAALGLSGSSLARPALESLSRETAVPQDGGGPPALVAIYLRGGADILNMIIPCEDPTYALARPGIGIGEADGRLALDDEWALHPALAPLLPLYKEGLLAPLVNVGSPHTTRSHFDAQDFMEFAAPGNRSVRSGWLNRYLEVTSQVRARRSRGASQDGEVRAPGMQGLLPRSLRGDYPVLAVPEDAGSADSNAALDRFEKFYGAGQGSGGMDERPVEGGEDGSAVVASGKVTIETLRRLQEIVGTGEQRDYGYPKSGFGSGLSRIGQVIASGAGLEVAGIDIGGWDHHANQGGTDGRHAQMLGDLAQSLAAFARQQGSRMERTMVLVMSEFGRTVNENGSNGTDHGHGGGMLLLGGGVEGGRVLGEWRGLRSDQLHQGRDLPVTTDFRDVFAEVLRNLFDFKTPKEFFPDYRPGRLKLFG